MNNVIKITGHVHQAWIVRVSSTLTASLIEFLRGRTLFSVTINAEENGNELWDDFRINGAEPESHLHTLLEDFWRQRLQ